MEALKSDLICFWLYSLSPASPPALHEACLASYLQFCTCVSPLLPLCPQFFEGAVPIACVSHYLLFTPFSPGSYSTFDTPLLWECFLNLLSSPG